jgi:hypothetical protein
MGRRTWLGCKSSFFYVIFVINNFINDIIRFLQLAGTGGSRPG